MSLKDLVVEQETIPAGNTTITVTGLTITSLVGLVADYKTEMAMLFGDKKGADALADMATSSPKFIATLIANAAGEPDQVESAEKLPLGVQLTAIRKIWDLTSLDSAELGNLLGEVLTLLEVVTANLPSNKPVIEKQEDSKQS